MSQPASCRSKVFPGIFVAIVVAVSAALSAAISGCAPISSDAKYLFSPDVYACPPSVDSNGITYIQDNPSIYGWCTAKVKQPVPIGQTGQSIPGESQEPRAVVTVSQATAYARQIEEEYRGAKLEYGSISSGFGLLLIPAGASALALGAEGVGATAVTSLGVGSAALLGAGYWLSNKPREKVYMTGANALECLIDTMQPFDTGQTNFGKLNRTVQVMSDKVSLLNLNTQNLDGQLLTTKTDINNIPKDASNPNIKPVLCYAEMALKAARANSLAESKAYDAATKYQEFSQRYAGANMVNVTNSINNKVGAAMTDNEPDLSALASRLSSTIPTSAQSLAGISNASSAVAAAAATTQKVSINLPAALKAQLAASGGGGKGVPSATKPQPPLSGETTYELIKLIDAAAGLQYQSYDLNIKTETVVDLTPDDIKPKTEVCTKLFDQPGAAPDLLTLNPGGYVFVKQGDTVLVAISGGKLPYAVQFMCDCYGSGITAATNYTGDAKATIEIKASDAAKEGSYPLMVTDSTGIGRPLTIVVPDKSKTDYSDMPDCGPEPLTIASTGAGGKGGVAARVKAKEDAAEAAAENAATYEGLVKKALDTINASNSSTAILKALNVAISARDKAKAAAATASTDAALVTALAGSDPSLKVYVDGAQAAALEAKAHADSAANLATQAALAAKKLGG